MEINEFIGRGLAEGWIKETGNVGSVRIDGKNEDREVYEVRVDKLHYNVQNGRIATSVSRRQMREGALPKDPAELNDVIEQMIVDDNPQRLKTTKLDIKVKGQQEVAIILSDGTVIDGNRRFTCLRMLSREEREPRFLRCYVFPDTYDKKAIKALELEIQLGQDEKLGYDAIARLVDINECVSSGLMSAEEYARHANMKPNDMKKALRQIGLMNDFLEFVNAPGAYHIAQDMKLDGPLADLAQRLSRCRNEDQREDVKQVVFANLVMQNTGDRTRNVRQLIDDLVASDNQGDGFMEEQLDYAERVLEKLEDAPEDTRVTTEFIRDKVSSDAELKAGQKASCEKARRKAGNREIKDGQVRNVREALESLEEVDMALFAKLEEPRLEEMLKTLDDVMACAADLMVGVKSALSDRRA